MRISFNVQSRLGLALAVGGIWLTPANAWAGRKATPFGEIDESCITHVPKGGRIDVERGSVEINGSKTASAASCAEPIPGCSTNGGWYENSWANAKTISGMSQYDHIAADWTVPTNPSPPAGDSPLEYFFPSLSAMSGSRSVAIIQPVMSWGYDAQEWEVSSWGLFNCNVSCSCQVFVEGPYSGVYAGDSVGGVVSQYQGSPDAWQVFISDSSSGANANLDVYNIPNSWPKFTTAQSAVNENYGLNSCADLSPQNYLWFTSVVLEQAGPSWNSFNNVTSSTSWTIQNNTSGLSPSCSWSAGASGSVGLLTWAE
jgi:hypothetical protein